jgi:type II secretory pathway pseudopilin PulG
MKNKNTSYLKSVYFSGFTLIELLVLVVDLILAMAVLLFSGFVSQRRVEAAASLNADTHCIDVKALDGQGFFSQTQSNSIKLTGRGRYPGGLRQWMEFCAAPRSSDIDKNAVSIEPSGFANRGQYGSFAT